MPPSKATKKEKKKTKISTLKEKRKHFKYTEEALAQAVQAIRSQKKGIREACRDYGVPRSTVQDRIAGRVPEKPRKVGPEPLLGFEGEKKVVEWIIELAKCGIPVTKAQLLDTVSQLLKDLGKSDKLPLLDKDRKLPKIGQTWYMGFRKRNPEITVREPEAINKGREAVTESKIRNWFTDLKSFLEERGLTYVMNDPDRIFNADETGVSLCPKTGKVLAPRGYKNVYVVKKGTDKETLTVLVMMNASGKIAPPLIVFPYVKPPKAVVNNMPPGWILGKSETGWMRSDVFFEYIANDFNDWLEKCSIQKPVILFVDGHRSHMSLPLSKFCEENDIILYALPPNTTHIMQPADVSVFRPLKQEWQKTVRNWQAKPENCNKSVTKTNFAKVFQETIDKDMTVSIKNGFRRCGLYPFNVEAVDYTKCVKDFQMRKKHLEPTQACEFSEQDYIIAKNVVTSIKDNLSQKGIDAVKVCDEIQLAQSCRKPKSRSNSKTPRKSTELIKPKTPEQQIILNDGEISPYVGKSGSKSTPQKSIEIINNTTPKTPEQPKVSENDDDIGKGAENSLLEDVTFPDIGSYVSLDEISVLNNISDINVEFIGLETLNVVSIEDVDRETSPKSSAIEKIPVNSENRENTLKSPNPVILNKTVADPFAKHLKYPVESDKLNTKKKINMNKYPSAISSQKWRDAYNIKEEQKQKLIDEKNNRKIEREKRKNEPAAKKRNISTTKKTKPTNRGKENKEKENSDTSLEENSLSSDTDIDTQFILPTNSKRKMKNMVKKVPNSEERKNPVQQMPKRIYSKYPVNKLKETLKEKRQNTEQAENEENSKENSSEENIIEEDINIEKKEKTQNKEQAENEENSKEDTRKEDMIEEDIKIEVEIEEDLTIF